MFYDLLVNENYIINNDICNNELNEFIKNQKYYILETVYNFLNDEKKDKYNYETFCGYFSVPYNGGPFYR